MTHLSNIGPCWEWLGSLSGGKCGGYGRIGINGHYIGAHVISWLIAGNDIPDDMLVCHKCDNRSCVNPDHLYIGTNHTNTQDMYDRDRLRQDGENNGHCKLTKEQVIEIHNSTLPSRKLGMIYDVSKTQILRIKNYQQWV